MIECYPKENQKALYISYVDKIVDWRQMYELRANFATFHQSPLCSFDVAELRNSLFIL